MSRIKGVGQVLATVADRVKDTPDFGRGKAVDFLGDGVDMIQDRIREPGPDKIACAMWQELTKMADERDDRVHGGMVAGGWLGRIAAKEGIGALSGHLVNSLRTGPGNKELSLKIIANADPAVTFARHTADPTFAGYVGPGLAQGIKDHYVILGDLAANSPATVAHELGHAEIAKNRLGRVIQNRTTLNMANHPHTVGAIAGGLSGLSDNPYLHAAGIAAPMIAAAPQLLYEGGASLLGARAIRRAGGSWADMGQAAGRMTKALGTYALHAGAGVGTALMAHGGVRAARAALGDSQEKEAFATNEYSGPMGGVRFQQASQLPNVPVPGLARAIEKPQPKFAAALTPAGRLVASQQTGKGFGRIAKGPSIAGVAKPPRMGTPIPGATEGL